MPSTWDRLTQRLENVAEQLAKVAKTITDFQAAVQRALPAVTTTNFRLARELQDLQSAAAVANAESDVTAVAGRLKRNQVALDQAQRRHILTDAFTQYGCLLSVSAGA